MRWVIGLVVGLITMLVANGTLVYFALHGADPYVPSYNEVER